jgi:predicted methyltransferase
MAEPAPIDLRAALNAVSDVIQNRPRPLREMDQIYMKAADMVLQSEYVARWSAGRRLAFIGDGDAISVCVAYLHRRSIVDYGPSHITVFDFDERICNAITRFADKERLENIEAKLYNVVDPIECEEPYGCFYTNPPWGASNEGTSVKHFVRRGMEAVNYRGEGTIVIADDPELPWAQHVLANTQRFVLANGFYVSRHVPQLHSYHLDDAPLLKSCNLVVRALPNAVAPGASEAITDETELQNFYGRDKDLWTKYVRERNRVDYGRANSDEYYLEPVVGRSTE